MDITKIKQLFLRVMVGCLIAAAGVAVVTVLLGSFNEVCARALFTILLVALHALISLAFIKNNEKQDTFETLALFTNATFTLIILSFLTSILGTWTVIGGELVARLYGLYVVLLFAVLHAEVLYKMRGKQPLVDRLMTTNYVFMLVVVGMLVPVLFSPGLSDLPGYYYRVLAASGIIDATLTLIAVIIHNIYVQKHPQRADPVFLAPLQPAKPAATTAPLPAVPQASRHMNVFVKVLLVYVALQVAGGVLFMCLSFMTKS